MISKKDYNKLKNIVLSEAPLTKADEEYLYENGKEYYDILKSDLLGGKYKKERNKCRAVKLMFVLRKFNRSQDFINILSDHIRDSGAKLRSCCFNTLSIIAIEIFRGLSSEFDIEYAKENIIPVLTEAMAYGISEDSKMLAENYLGDFL